MAHSTVLASGAICWKVSGGKLYVLLIHRPRYNDWSWPKGKLESGETLAECAAREVHEETGYQISLGIPLAGTTYSLPSGDRKVVSYWAAEVAPRQRQNTKVIDRHEVDRTLWIKAENALDKLSKTDDKAPLKDLITAHESHALRTWPLIVLRHGTAQSRASWKKSEETRPLLPSGQKQAKALTRLLSAWDARRIVTSPWTRCKATVEPYRKKNGAKVLTANTLSEKGHLKNKKSTSTLLKKILSQGTPTVVCTHRPVLEDIFDQLGEHFSGSVTDAGDSKYPRQDPYLKPAEIVVSHISVKRPGRVLAVEKHAPTV